ncbi:hypothetical protein [Nocardia testacea]|uniref:hypothetical protein n=1 Tax=Nocardia testacea TaxID=248551 RepID=UPI0033DAC3FF
MSQARVAPPGGPAAAVADRLVSGIRTLGSAVRLGVRVTAIVVADSARPRFPVRETLVQADIAVEMQNLNGGSGRRVRGRPTRAGTPAPLNVAPTTQEKE